MQPKSSDFPNIADLLFSYWKVLILAITLGGFIGISLMPKRPPMWAASGLVRIAQINGSAPLIDAATAATIVQQPGFTSDSLENAGLPRDPYADPKALLALKTLVAIPQRSPNLVQLQVSAYSPDEAKRILEGAVVTLQQQTADDFHEGVQERKRKIEETETLLAANAREGNAVITALKSGQPASTTQLSDALLVSYLLRVTQTESERLRISINGLREQLSPTRTFNSKLLTPISVSPLPPGGSKVASGAIGAFIGFIIAFVLTLLHNFIRTRRPLSGLINRS